MFLKIHRKEIKNKTKNYKRDKQTSIKNQQNDKKATNKPASI